jgi:DNA modification methylase
MSKPKKAVTEAQAVTMEADITEWWAIYHGDCVELMRQLPSKSVHMSVYSPPFAQREAAGGALYQYSSSPVDMSNCRSYEEFFEHYEFAVREMARITLPGRMTCVHCIDVPSGNSGKDKLVDFQGDIVRLHERLGFDFVDRILIWKEPLGVRNRTMAKNLAHKTMVEDSTLSAVAGADYLLVFRNAGDNPIPVAHPTGLTEYAGSKPIPSEILHYRNWQGNQIENKFSQWIWRQYASSAWLDVRIDRVLPFQNAREDDSERHVHPLQRDVADRAIVLWSNPGEVIFTPFMGVSTEVYSAVYNGRKGIGAELKDSYFRQARSNMAFALKERAGEQGLLPYDNVSEILSESELENIESEQPQIAVAEADADEFAEV